MSALSLGPDRARLAVRVFKEGLLAAVGHDLLLQVTRFTLTVDEAAATVELRAEAASLRVIAALRDGRELPSALSARDVATIEGAIARDVLEAHRHPEIVFTGRGDRARVEGTLRLHGCERSLTFAPISEGDRLRARIRLHQPDFAIKPYRALLGALRIKPDVEVEVVW